MKKVRFLIPFLAISLLFLFGCSGKQSYKRTRLYMGTTAEFNIPMANLSRPELKEACDAAESEIARIDTLFSIFDAKSAVSKINDDNKKRAVKACPELLMLVKRAKEYTILTHGAFDITVGPLTEIWGFGASEKKHPDAQTINSILQHVGLDKIELDEQGQALIFKSPKVRMDFGGIAKGYAVDEAIKIFKRYGITNALVNMGGDLYCLGAGANNKDWSIGIKDPEDKDKILAILNVRDKAIATSGDYENFYIDNKKKFAHIIDPHTGYPASNNLLSVTIIADDCTTADALATAVFVLGETKGLELIEKLSGIECFLIVDSKDKPTVLFSNGMARYMEKAQ